jgi:hypothetical protein
MSWATRRTASFTTTVVRIFWFGSDSPTRLSTVPHNLSNDGQSFLIRSLVPFADAAAGALLDGSTVGDDVEQPLERRQLVRIIAL